jgi:hypothetical protein
LRPPTAVALAVNNGLILSMAGSFQKGDCLLVTPLLLFVQREVVTNKAHRTRTELFAEALHRILALHKTLNAIEDKVRKYAPSRLITCEVTTRRKDSRQCEARGLKQDHNYERLKFQLRLTLSDEFAQVARNVPGDPSISTLTDILNRHDAVMKCQFDAFADYVSEAEANGIENFDLYEWTKKTIDDPAKKSKYTKSFALYVGGDEVYEKDKADALEAELKPLVGGPIVAKMFKYDTDPAHNPQPPRQT